MKDFMPLITAALLLVTISLIVLTREGSKNIDWHNVPADGEDISNYGIDISWPIQGKVSTNYPWLPHNVDPIINPTPIQYQEMPLQPFGNDGRHQAYMKHLEGCRSFYTNKEDSGMCDVYDFDRMLMNKRQPQSMQNYTEIGFKKIPSPPRIQALIKDFWEKNKDKQKPEVWPAGNIYVNHWTSPTMMVSVDDTGLRGSGFVLKKAIWDELHDTIEDWTGEDITPVSMYGIRVYTNNSVVVPHCDRLPLVASAMVNVAQDVEEDWPYEIYDHNGQAHNISLHPGDMLLFESHSVIHGRPFPMNGKFNAMLFIHFEPTGHSLRHNAKSPRGDVEKEYKQHVEEGHGGQSSEETNTLPPYVKRFSPEEEHWQMRHPEGWRQPVTWKRERRQEDSPANHKAARSGDVDVLKEELLNAKEHVVNERDDSGWQLIHEAAASGKVRALELLLNNGADLNARTNGGRGATPLYLAQQALGKKHKMVKYLKNLGALSVPPDRVPGGSEL